MSPTTQWKLGYQLMKKHKLAELWAKVKDSEDEPDEDKQKAVRDAMNKLNSWANKIIKGVQEGVFPSLK